MRYKEYSTVFLLGVLFSLGLGISGMMSPLNIQAFLYVAGHWNGALLVVLGSASLTTVLLYPLVLKQKAPIFRAQFSLPTRKDVDGKLLLGSAFFGIGWALTGLCPGPAFAQLSSVSPIIVLYCVLLLGTYALYERFQ